ncbi:MAG: GTPase Era [Desulfovibrio sp.]|jgi:GTP-binding protein Era|nr:GTPase Era [Desulfovibrio sp.]
MSTTLPPFKCGLVALIGPPNAGKSTFLNKCLGRKVAIVSPLPQTTRNRITGILSEKDAQVIFVDTPGIHKPRGKMNRAMVHSAWQSLESADVVGIIIDADLYARHPDFFANDTASLHGATTDATRPVFIIANKVDLLGDKSRLLPLLEAADSTWPGAEIFPVSSASGEGLPQLLAAIKNALPESPPLFPEDMLSTLPLRFMAAEIIREKLFLFLRQELPYSTAVDIEAWEEDAKSGHVTIHAVIYVAKSTHKAMVIGHAGRNIKQVGQSARKEIMELLGRKAHLQLWVKIKENWADDHAFLHSLEPATGMPGW